MSHHGTSSQDNYARIFCFQLTVLRSMSGKENSSGDTIRERQSHSWMSLTEDGVKSILFTSVFFSLWNFNPSKINPEYLVQKLSKKKLNFVLPLLPFIDQSQQNHFGKFQKSNIHFTQWKYTFLDKDISTEIQPKTFDTIIYSSMYDVCTMLSMDKILLWFWHSRNWKNSIITLYFILMYFTQ